LYVETGIGSRNKRKDLGGVMSKDCIDTLQTLKTVTKRECDAKWEQSICQMWSSAELSRSGKLRMNSSVFNWRLKDASEDYVILIFLIILITNRLQFATLRFKFKYGYN